MKNGRGTSRRAIRLAEILIVFGCCAAHFTLEARAGPVIPETGVVQYLSQFGYLPPVNPKSEAIISEETMSEAISEFQSFMGINVTGNIDAKTAHMMALPRCGVKDKVGSGAGGRSKRYALFGSRWPYKSLTYKITQYSKKLDRRVVDQEIARAFAVWSDYTDLTFKPAYGRADIEIRFVQSYHGDHEPFDGPGRTLAHAYSPGPDIGGDAHFDDSEVWTVNTYHGINLFQVAAHEFGHSLGLDHSNIRAALMAPIYRTYEPDFQLHNDDIAAIQRLYGRKGERRFYGFFGLRYQSASESKNEAVDICEDPQIDTIFNTAEGDIYVFKGDHYWKLTTDGIAAGYPKLIAEGWTGLPSNIDAAFAYDKQTYFFKGSEYWIYVDGQMDGHYPKKIRNDFPGIPDNIGAATARNVDGLIYFFKGANFWRFNLAQQPLVGEAYPELISNWSGFPENLDAALSYKGDIYFFKGGAHYRFNEGSSSMDSGSPHPTGSTLFGCPSKSNDVLLSDE